MGKIVQIIKGSLGIKHYELSFQKVVCTVYVGMGGGGVGRGMGLLQSQPVPCAIPFTINAYLKNRVHTMCRGFYHMPNGI